jgi:hypothetical protein
MNTAKSVTATFSPANYVFVTSTTVVAGALAGMGVNGDPLDAADTICNTRAAAGGLSGHYVAFLSTSTVNANSRFGSARGWIRPDGKPFADLAQQAGSGAVLYPPRITEAKNDVSGSTVTGLSGSVNGTFQNATCSDWTSLTGRSMAGDPSGSLWANDGSVANCSAAFRLYCFGTDYSAVLTYPKASGRLAFASSDAFVLSSSTNIASADAICASEASANGLPGTYLALLATTSASAASRFDATGAPWVRTDGIPIVTTAAQLFANSGNLLAGIDVAADGVTREDGWDSWGGSLDINTAGSNGDCMSWSDTLNSDTGFTGLIGSTVGTKFFSASGAGCDFTGGKLYCLQK